MVEVNSNVKTVKFIKVDTNTVSLKFEKNAIVKLKNNFYLYRFYMLSKFILYWILFILIVKIYTKKHLKLLILM